MFASLYKCCLLTVIYSYWPAPSVTVCGCWAGKHHMLVVILDCLEGEWYCFQGYWAKNSQILTMETFGSYRNAKIVTLQS